MRLYLSSFGLGRAPLRLLTLLGGRARAAVIVNAYDLMSDADRATRVREQLAALTDLGLQAQELDLRHYFDGADRRRRLESDVGASDLIWVRGGNTFVLRRAMKQSGFDRVLEERLALDTVVYGGFSAAIGVLPPSLRGIELVDDSTAVPEGYDPEPVWDGLGLLQYAVAPHYRSDHPESAAIEHVVQYYIDNHVPFIALRDGDVIVIDGSRQEILS